MKFIINKDKGTLTPERGWKYHITQGPHPPKGAYSRGPTTPWQVFGRGVHVSKDYKLKQGFFH